MALLTRRGWSLLGAAVGLVAAGRLLGTPELSALGIAGLALLIAAAAWTRRRTFPAQLVRTVRPTHARVGSDARVDLELVATGPIPQATVTDAFDGGRRAARFVSPALPRGARARAAYRVPTDRRGRFAIGGTQIGIGDPFGMTRHTIVRAGTDEIVVVPRVHDLRRAPAVGGERRTRTERSVVIPQPHAAFDEFLALREYQAGDDLRRVHWRSSARLGELVVRDDETAWQPRTVVLLDNRRADAATGRAATLADLDYETAIEAVASIAIHLSRGGGTCEVLTTAGRQLGARPGGTLRPDRLLEELAVLTPDEDANVSAVVATLRPPARRGTLVAVTPATSAADVACFAALAGPGAPVVLVACGPDAPMAASREVRVISGRPDRLAEEWAAATAPRRGRRRIAR